MIETKTKSSDKKVVIDFLKHLRPDQLELVEYILPPKVIYKMRQYNDTISWKDAGILEPRISFLMCHRQWGKDEVAFIITILSALICPGSNYWYIFDTAKNAHDNFWIQKGADGRPRPMSYFPENSGIEVVLKENPSHTIDIRLPHWKKDVWSTITLTGASDVDAKRGATINGIVLSEFAFMDEEIWDVVEPVTARKNAWVIIATTPKGTNHAFQFMNKLAALPWAWTRTLNATQTSVFTPEELAHKKETMSPARFEREYMCNPYAVDDSQVYAEPLDRLENAGLIGESFIKGEYPVHTAWDLGGDGTSIWFFQAYDDYRANICNFFENKKIIQLDYYTDNVRRIYGEMGIKENMIGCAILPVDAFNNRLGQDETQATKIAKLLSTTPIYCPRDKKTGVGVDRVVNRMFQKKMYFSAKECHTGLEHLKSYEMRKSEDGSRLDTDYHSKHSHAADALRHLDTVVGIYGDTLNKMNTVIEAYKPEEGLFYGAKPAQYTSPFGKRSLQQDRQDNDRGARFLRSIAS